MKKEKRIIYFGEDFTEKKGIYKEENTKFSDFKGLYQCYNRPSGAKQQIYEKYEDLLKKNTDDFNKLYYGVKGFNSCIFTLHAIVTKNKKTYYLYITPSYNYFEEIEA